MAVPLTHGARERTGSSGSKERLVVVDAVRALALLGVLIMNLRSMSGLEYLSAAALQAVQDPLDRAVDTVLEVLVDKKSLSAFSFLFGLSFTLLMERRAGQSVSFLLMYTRRLVVLAGFGLVNIAFFYWGDILITYALLGALLLIAVRLPLWVVLGAAALLLLGAPALMAAMGAVRGPDVQTAADLEALAAFSSPAFIDSVAHGFERYFFLTGTEGMIDHWDITNIFGLFLLGLWTGRRRIPHDLGDHRRLLWSVALVGLPVGLVASAAEVLIPSSSPLSTLMLAGTPVLALGYMASAALLLDLPAARPVREALAPAGRLALTNYLAYGLVGQVVFHGWALGQLGRLGTAEVLGIALVAYALLLAASHAWLIPFRIGPTEWVWRSLTQLSVQPLRREASAAGG